MRRLSILAVASLAAVTACASVPTASPQLTESARNFTPSAGKARIYVFRSGSIVGSAVGIPIDVDGRVVGMTAKSTFLMVEVDPGQHTVSARSNENMGMVQVNAVAGQNYFVKVWPRMGVVSARAGIEIASQEEGRTAVINTRMAEGVPQAQPQPTSTTKP